MSRLPPIGSSGFGMNRVCGDRREPCPPAGIMQAVRIVHILAMLESCGFKNSPC